MEEKFARLQGVRSGVVVRDLAARRDDGREREHGAARGRCGLHRRRDLELRLPRLRHPHGRAVDLIGERERVLDLGHLLGRLDEPLRDHRVHQSF